MSEGEKKLMRVHPGGINTLIYRPDGEPARSEVPGGEGILAFEDKDQAKTYLDSLRPHLKGDKSIQGEFTFRTLSNAELLNEVRRAKENGLRYLIVVYRQDDDTETIGKGAIELDEAERILSKK